jgi:hypothetical protein
MTILPIRLFRAIAEGTALRAIAFGSGQSPIAVSPEEACANKGASFATEKAAVAPSLQRHKADNGYNVYVTSPGDRHFVVHRRLLNLKI